MPLKDLAWYSLSECLRVQMDGKRACQQCDLYETDRCGGKDILCSGQNKKGYHITENGLSDRQETSNTKKTKKRKK